MASNACRTHLKGFKVDRGAVGVLSLDEDQADGGRGHR